MSYWHPRCVVLAFPVAQKLIVPCFVEQILQAGLEAEKSRGVAVFKYD